MLRDVLETDLLEERGTVAAGDRARAGGDARTMEHLNEMRRRIQAAQVSSGC